MHLPPIGDNYVWTLTDIYLALDELTSHQSFFLSKHSINNKYIYMKQLNVLLVLIPLIQINDLTVLNNRAISNVCSRNK